VPRDAGQPSDSDPQTERGVFATTHWSVVLAAGQSDSSEGAAAMENLCRLYWFPLYAFVRRQGHPVHDAQDLTQEFFARFLAKEYIGRADATRGRFRNFLLACLKHFLAEQWRHAGRLKRGGGQALISWDSQTAEERLQSEPLDLLTPEKIYDRRWALTLLEQVLPRLGAEQSAAGKAAAFAQLKDYLWGEGSGGSYAEMATQLGLTEGALKVTIHRLRQRFRELLREEVAQTVAATHEVDEELRYLVSVIRADGC
jgi:RNA polymerase sigma-70 factor (ECF subfamily)